ncbi:MAG: hypothetical protein F6K44_32715, partial [Moorea sp. SIO3E2]|nr:hypothetical protein [Moorena sp. SIO3E2]
EAISVIQPRVVCLEHNHSYPPPQEWIMPYDPNFRWDCNSSAYGASLVALEKLARRKGMVLVGCGLYSANGFYVREDLVNDAFSPPFTPERFFNPLDYQKIVSFPPRAAGDAKPSNSHPFKIIGGFVKIKTKQLLKQILGKSN